MFDSIYHMPFISLKIINLHENVKILPSFMQLYNGCIVTKYVYHEHRDSQENIFSVKLR